jgi:hypothetical protein
MTPRERAEKLIATERYWEYDDQVNFGILENDIADAIKAAENEAFERAALRTIEFLSGSAISKPIAEVIRFLKHEEK